MVLPEGPKCPKGAEVVGAEVVGAEVTINLSLCVLYKHDENPIYSRGVFSFINNHETAQVFLPNEKNMKLTLG